MLEARSSKLGSGHPVAWQWGDGTLATCGAYCGKSAMQYFCAGLVAVDSVIMAAVGGADIDKFGEGRVEDGRRKGRGHA